MSDLTLYPAPYQGYHTVFRTKHGRRIYLSLLRTDNDCFTIVDCHYIDRTWSKRPKKFITRVIESHKLLDVISAELDRYFAEVIYSEEILTKSELISEFIMSNKKSILIMLREGPLLRTIFKNRYRRSILLEIKLESDSSAYIKTCRYCDKRANGTEISPYGLTTISFMFSLDQLLNIINTELEGGFTDVLITDEHTIILDRPICGSV